MNSPNIQKKVVTRIKIRRGVEAQRVLVIFEEGEPVFIKDKKKLYVGDGKTYGGVVQTHKNFITNNDNRPIESEIFDTVYNYQKNTFYAIDTKGNLVSIIPNSTSLINKIVDDINTISNLLYRLSTEACNDALMLKSDSDDNITTDNSNRLKVKEFNG